MPEEKNNFLQKIKENIVVEIIGVILIASLIFFGNSITKSMKQVEDNKIEIAVLTEKDKNKNEKIEEAIEQLQAFATSMGEFSSETERLKLSVVRLEEIVKILRDIVTQ